MYPGLIEEIVEVLELSDPNLMVSMSTTPHTCQRTTYALCVSTHTTLHTVCSVYIYHIFWACTDGDVSIVLSAHHTCFTGHQIGSIEGPHGRCSFGQELETQRDRGEHRGIRLPRLPAHPSERVYQYIQ